MKKLSLVRILEGLFHPELPGPHNRHKAPRPIRTVGSNTFPYTDDAGETMSDEEIADELQLEFKTGRTISGADNLSGHKVGGSQDWKGGKSNKSFSNFAPNENKEDPEELELTRALPVSYLNYDEGEEDYSEIEKHFVNEMRGARERATKEMGPISTKQPWLNGIPNKEDAYMMAGEDILEPDERIHPIDEPDEETEEELGLSLESIWATTNFSVHSQGKKVRGAHEDLDFFSNISDDHPYLMNTESEFEENQKEGSNEKEEETEG